MPRHSRIAPAGDTCHVLNRPAGRMTLFKDPADFAACECAFLQAHARFPSPSSPGAS